MTQADFTRKSGLSRSTVSEWARGTRTPDPASCQLISDYLPVDLDEVLEAAGHRPPSFDLPPGDPRRTIISMIRQLDPEDSTTLFWLESLPLQ